MYYAFHQALVGAYVLAPVVAAAWAMVMARRLRRSGPVWSLVFTVVVGSALAISLCNVYAVALESKVPLSQTFKASYFMTALLLLLRGFNGLLENGIARLLRVRQTAAGHPHYTNTFKGTIAFVSRALVLFGIGLPFVMAAVLTYRPKVIPLDNPQKQLGFDFREVSFTTSDGIDISAWWIPAFDRPSRLEPTADERWGRHTVIVCHGLGANKANQLIMARYLIPNGFNVLALDFRAHGASGGQVTSYGDREREDVLAAVRWVRTQQPEQSHRIFGVGASLGAAALIAAAADPSDEGRSIEAVAVYGTYANLGDLTQSVADSFFPAPLNWLARRVAMPIASLHAGVDLASFAPGHHVADLWPHPILVIHGTEDEIIPFNQGMRLFNGAVQPKQSLWIVGDHNSIVADDAAARRVQQFFEQARSEPVI